MYNLLVNDGEKRKKLQKYFVSAFLIIALSIMTGCSDDSTNPAGSPSKVEGRVTDDGGFNKLDKISSNVEGEQLF